MASAPPTCTYSIHSLIIIQKTLSTWKHVCRAACALTQKCHSFVLSNTMICIIMQYIKSGVHKFTKEFRGHFKILGTRWVTWRKVQHWGSKTIRCHNATFCHHSNLVPGICLTLCWLSGDNTDLLFDGSTYCKVYMSYISLTNNTSLNYI
jgi:hypothetical protein